MDLSPLERRYDLLSVLGEGGMGTVYRVADRLDGKREVALKTIKHAGAVTPEQRLRFKDEFLAMARLRHPNTIEVHDFGQLDETCLYITMELVPGRELTDAIGGVPMPLSTAYPLLIQLLQALDFVHARQFVHRDIKSQNIRVRDDGRLKLMDFGLMGQLGQQSARTVTGSPGYMAPEVALGGRIEASSDLYSVGCLAYEMLTGQLPFAGTLGQVVRAHISQPPPSPRTLRPELPERLERIVMRLLEKEQGRRYQSALEVMDDLAPLAGIAITHENLEQRHSYLNTGAIVGRDAEIASLQGALKGALAGRSGAWMVGAPAGTGKSRLVQELVLQAKLDEVVVLHGECVETGMAPFEALTQALRPGLAHGNEAERERHRPALRQLFPEFAAGCGADEPLPDIATVADHVLAWLQSVSERVPLLWLMDDLHWADVQTLTVLNHCIRNLGPSRLLILGTFRNDETPPDSPVWYTLEDGTSTPLTLGPLAFEDQQALVGAMLKSFEIEADVARALYGATGGNAFFLTETLRALMEDDLLVRRDGRWRFPTEAAALAPLSSVEETVERRLGHLSRGARRLAGLAAVLGRGQDLCALQVVTGLDDDELFEGLAELVDRQFLHKHDGGYAFGHDRVREVLYERLDPALRRMLHQRVGEHLEANPRSDAAHQLHELAHHFGRGQDPARAYRYQRDAANQAEAAGADATALELWQRAATALEGADVPDKPRRELELAFLVGANAFVLRPLDGIAALTRVRELLEGREHEWPGLGFSLDEVYGLLAVAHGFSGCPETALEIAEISARRAEAAGRTDDVTLGVLSFQRCTGLMAMGRFDEAIAAGATAQRRLDAVSLEGVPGQFQGAMVGARTVQNVGVFQGYRPSAAIRDDANRVALAVTGDVKPFTVQMPFGLHAAWSGRQEEALAYLDETQQKCRRTGAAPYPYMLYVRAYLPWQRGDFAGALALVEQGLSHGHVRQHLVPSALLELLRCRILVDLGRADEVLERLEAGAVKALDGNLKYIHMLACLELAYAAVERGDLDAARGRLEGVYRQAEEGELRNPLVQARAGRLLAGVLAKQGEGARAVRLGEEAIAIARRPDIDLPDEEAHARIALATALAARGDHLAAAAALREAGDLFHQQRNAHWLHATMTLMEALPQLASRVAAAPPPAEAGVEARWKFVRGGML